MHKIIAFLRTTSLFKRLSLGFLLLVFPPIIVLNLFWYCTFDNEVTSLSEKLMTSIMTHAENIVFKVFNEYEKASANIYSDSEIIDLLKTCNNYYLAGDFMNEKQGNYESIKIQLGQRLDTLTAHLPYVSNVQIVTSYDQFSTFNQNGYRKGGVIKDLPTFLESAYYTDTLAANGYPVWFDTTKIYDIFYRDSRNSYGIADTFTLTRAIKNPYTDITIGVLILNINASFLHQIFLTNPIPSQGNLLILNEYGSITSLITTPNAPIVDDYSPLLVELADSNEGSFTTFVENNYSLVRYVRIPNTSFYLANIMKHNVLISGALQSISAFLFWCILWTLMAGFIAYCITRSVSLPINQLKHTMSKVSLNQLDIQIPITSKDEVGILEMKFNQMVQDLKHLIHQIYTAELEQKELSFRKKNAELNALQMQINPHFLYNTLDIIRWEAMYQENGEGKVSKMIEDFSNLLRLGTKKDMDFVSLTEELNHVKAYLKVINYKFSNSVGLTLDFSFDTNLYAIPKLTLQPLVENAILHGFEGFEGKKEIFISGQLIEESIILSIQDTGRGISEDIIQSIYSQFTQSFIASKSIGLYNVNERMKLYFGSNYSFYINNPPNSGTLIELKFTTSLLTLPEGIDTHV